MIFLFDIGFLKGFECYLTTDDNFKVDLPREGRMNGEIPNVPITTLAGIKSLTSLLPELSLPSPLPSTLSNKSLFFHPKIAEEAKRIFATGDDRLASQLIWALKHTSTSYLKLRDGSACDSLEGEYPELLKAILAQNPTIFNTTKDCEAVRKVNGDLRKPSSELIKSTSREQTMTAPQTRTRSHSSQANSPAQAAVPPTPPPPATAQNKEVRKSSHSYNGKPFTVKSSTLQKTPTSLGNVKPVVVLQILTPKEQALAQKSVAAFTAKLPSKHGWSSSNRSRHKSKLTLKSHRSTSSHNCMNVDSDEDEYEKSFHRSKKPGKFFKRRNSSSSESNAERSKGKKWKSSEVKQQGFKKSYEGRCYSSLKESLKRRKKYVSDCDSSSEKERSRSPEELVPKKKRKKEKTLKGIDNHLSFEELMETPTFKRFNSAIDSVLENSEEYDLVAEADQNDEETEISSDSLISKNIMAEMATEAAKLKSMKLTQNCPHGKMVKLIILLERNIRDGSKILIHINQDDEDEEERKMWKELAFERLARSIDAALTVMYILTSPNMPKKVYIEDIIERVIKFSKFHLHNTIYPEFDPVYRIDQDGKDNFSGSNKLKRARAGSVKSKSILAMYNKFSDIVGLLAELIEIQVLTDTTILQISTLGVSSFFVENVSELQLGSIRLVTRIFSKYEKHRQLILEDIFASLARLPTSKRSIRNYRLNSEQNIQMVTALVLQLIQCIIKIPEREESYFSTIEPISSKNNEMNKNTKKTVDNDVLLVTTYENAMRTAVNFLSIFLKKCGNKSEEDYRPLFENFIQDLLTTVNKPEWPAAELILSLLGRLLVQNFSNKSIDMSLRVASIDYLGVVAARLRKDALSSQLNQESLDAILEQVQENAKERKSTSKEVIDVTQVLQRTMLDYLAFNAQNDPALLFARQFYIAQWFRDITLELEKALKRMGKSANKHHGDDSEKNEIVDNKNNQNRSRKEKYRNRHKDRHKKKKKTDSESDTDIIKENDQSNEILQNAERRKQFLFSTTLQSTTHNSIRKNQCKLDYECASLIARYLASKRPFSQSFDIYLTQILRVLNETAVAVRTKAMKCLTSVVEADPGILARADMQRGVHGRFLDQSTSVREAAVELVGKFVLIRPELTQQYYDMLIERILDTGISVRKRVIKILRDICLEQTEFEKITEICVKMIRRVNDEEGIKKLINEVFQNMWFTPVKEKNSKTLFRKVVNITDVVAACKESGFEWFEQLLENLLKKTDDNTHKQVLKACKQIVDCSVENILRLEENSVEAQESQGTSNQRLVACFSTLFLFSKIKPSLLVKHATTLQPYLNIKCSTQGDYLVLHNVTRILELVVPLMDHPSETFLAQLEEDMMKLIIKHGMLILQSCVSCLGVVVNNVTQNYKLVRDCFQKFFGVLIKLMLEHRQDPQNPTIVSNRSTLLRSLFTVGLLCKNFDFDKMELTQPKTTVSVSQADSSKSAEQPCRIMVSVMKSNNSTILSNNHTNFPPATIQPPLQQLPKVLQKPTSFGNIFQNMKEIIIKDRVFEVISYFLNYDDEEVQHKSLTGLGFFCVRHYDFMLGTKMKELYNSILTNVDASVKLKCQVLKNLQLYLSEEETKMIKQDSEWERLCKSQDLKEMGDVSSGMSSAVIQVYLKQVLDSFFHSEASVRLSAIQVINLILRQGLVHPVQCVPYLISMGTDTERAVRVKADQQIQEIDKKYAGFIHMKALQGVKMSYKLQQLIQNESGNHIRGFRDMDSPGGLNAFLYSLVRNNRQHRRALIMNLLKLFDEQAKTPLSELLYIADNLAYFPYQTQDEALFIIHHIDIIVSVSGSNLLQSFRESLTSSIEEEDEDENVLIDKIPEDVTVLRDCLEASQSCLLLLILKQHLKDMYGFSDAKIHNYSPAESGRIYEKSLNRKSHIRFEPISVLEHLKAKTLPTTQLSGEEKKDIVSQYLDFKQLMLSIDPDDDYDSAAELLKLKRQKNNPSEEGGEPADKEGTDKEGTEGESVTSPTKEALNKSSRFSSKVSRLSIIKKREKAKPLPKPKEKPRKKPKKRKSFFCNSDNDDEESDPDFLA